MFTPPLPSTPSNTPAPDDTNPDPVVNKPSVVVHRFFGDKLYKRVGDAWVKVQPRVNLAKLDAS